MNENVISLFLECYSFIARHNIPFLYLNDVFSPSSFSHHTAADDKYMLNVYFFPTTVTCTLVQKISHLIICCTSYSLSDYSTELQKKSSKSFDSEDDVG